MHQYHTTNLGAYNGLGASTATATIWGGVFAGAVLAVYIVPTVISVFVQNKWLGFESRLSNKEMLGRSAALGAVIGVIPAVLVGAGTFAAVKDSKSN